MPNSRLPILLYVVLLTFYVVAVLHEQKLYADGSFFRHLAAGRDFFSYSTDPRPDPFLWSAEGKIDAPRWPPTTWLGDALFFSLDWLSSLDSARVAGNPLAIIADIQGLMLLIGCLAAFQLCFLLSGSTLGSVCGAVSYGVLTIPFWKIGPESWLLALIPYALLSAERNSRWSLVWLVLITMFVANATELVILVPLGVALLRPRVPLLLACVAASISPAKLSWIAQPFQGFSSANPLLRSVAEWQTPNYHTYPMLAVGIGVVLALLLFRRTAFPRRLIPFLLVTLGLSLLSIKFQPLFAVAAAAVVALTLPALLERAPIFKIIGERSAGVVGGIVFLVVLLVVEQVLLSRERPDLQGRLAPLLLSLNEFKKSGNELRIFNDYTVGGELAWSRHGAFIDDRPWNIFEDYSEVVRLTDKWSDVLSRWKFNSALVRQDSSLFSVLTEREKWREVARGPSIVRTENGRPTEFGLAFLVKPSHSP